MKKNYRQEIGEKGEKIACRLLARKGYQIIERNFRRREGEIDIVCRKKDWLVFVEVKTRSSFVFGLGEEAVEKRKLEKIEAAGQKYLLAEKCPEKKWRIEVVTVFIDRKNRKIRVKHLTNL